MGRHRKSRSIWVNGRDERGRRALITVRPAHESVVLDRTGDGPVRLTLLDVGHLLGALRTAAAASIKPDDDHKAPPVRRVGFIVRGRSA